jgi:hypothetical protein
MLKLKPEAMLTEFLFFFPFLNFQINDFKRQFKRLTALSHLGNPIDEVAFFPLFKVLYNYPSHNENASLLLR